MYLQEQRWYQRIARRSLLPETPEPRNIITLDIQERDLIRIMGTKYYFLSQAVGDYIASKRVSSGLTQVDLASRLKKPQNFISNIERGQRRLDVFEVLEIADALGIDSDELFKSLAEIWKSKKNPA